MADTEFGQLTKMLQSGGLNPVQMSRYNELKAAGATLSTDEAPAFSFDYEAEAKKAYGELGTYYDRLLKEAQGDMNKVLARLVEDYDRGKRVRTEDYNQSLTAANQAAVNNAQRRGLYSQSAYDSGPGFGLADAIMRKARQPVDESYQRANEAADIARKRTETDAADSLERRKLDLEQERRTQAGELANERGSKAYQKWSATSLI